MVVRGYNGVAQVVQPGEAWPLPYRGAAYSVRNVEGKLAVVWEWNDLLLRCQGFPSELVGEVRRLKAGNGNFRITAHGAVITKVALPDGSYRPVYVGTYTGDLKFPGVDSNPEGLKAGMYWTGFPFEGGETWSVSDSDDQGHLRWRYKGLWLASTKPFPGLSRRYRSLRQRGGRLYVTEHGHIWMNVRREEMTYHMREQAQRMQATQVRQFEEEENDILLQLIVARIQQTGCIPMYLGHAREFDHGEAPWTYFGAQQAWGSGSENGSDEMMNGNYRATLHG